MDNLKLPAYPEIEWQELPNGQIVYKSVGGFTKLELASLRVAPSLLTNPMTAHFSDVTIAEYAVRLAKGILEEANK